MTNNLTFNLRRTISAAFFCAFLFGSATQCSGASARTILDLLIKHKRSPGNSVSCLKGAPKDLRKLSEFRELSQPDQSQLLLLARDAANRYALAHPKNSNMRRQWSLLEATYCEHWLDWYTAKRSNFIGTKEVTSGTMEETRVLVIGYLGEALYEAGESLRVCQHFVDYSKEPFVDSSWLETWSNALIGKYGPISDPSAVRAAVRDSLRSVTGSDAKDVIERWKRFCAVIKNSRFAEFHKWSDLQHAIESSLQVESPSS